MLIHSFASTYRAQYEIKLPVDRRQWHVWIWAGIVKSWTDLWSVDLPPALPLISGYLVNSACRSNLHGFLLFQNDLKLRFNAYTFNNVFHLILHKLCKLSPCCICLKLSFVVEIVIMIMLCTMCLISTGYLYAFSMVSFKLLAIVV